MASIGFCNRHAAGMAITHYGLVRYSGLRNSEHVI
jgi:hypothetical protein